MFFDAAVKLSRRLALMLILPCFTARLAAAPTGPTLHLDYGQGEPHDNPISKFMYFVPLISPEPVSVFTNVGNTQCARVLSFSCRTNGATFHAICKFNFTGTGSQRNVFDNHAKIKEHHKQLLAGDTIKHVLSAINITGTGGGDVEVDGTLTNGRPAVNLVRMHFNRNGQTSPVTIDLQDFYYRNGAVQVENRVVARVNMLTFQRKPGTPKMEVSLASIKRKDAGNSAWQNFWGNLKGMTANLFLPPLKIEPEGQQAMLQFGLALATKAPKFTFPLATRLMGMKPDTSE